MALLLNGHNCSITFASDVSPGIECELMTFTPWSYEVADIPTTSMNNTKYHTSNPSPLVKVSPATGTFKYASADRGKILAFINVNQSIESTLPDGSTETVYGYINSMSAGEMTPEGLPTLTLSIMPTMHTGGTETAPVFA